MKRNFNEIDYTRVLGTIYVIVSLVTLAIFFFTPKSATPDESIGLYTLAMWGAMLSAVAAVVLILVAAARSRL